MDDLNRGGRVPPSDEPPTLSLFYSRNLIEMKPSAKIEVVEDSKAYKIGICKLPSRSTV
uniref:Uncharacterized protein n=1 Tax=Arundo donax TaxID=35708 RepID=A0A0A9DKN1_ARUDO